MNHIYKSIFNKALGVFVAVPEFASAHGKSTQSSNDVVGSSVAGGVLKTAITGLTFMIWMALSANQAVAAPGIYINDGRDGNCQAISDHTNQGGMYSLINKEVYVVNGGKAAQPQPGYFNLGVNYLNNLTGRPDQYNPCISESDAPHHANTQTNRTLFYGDPEFNGVSDNQNTNGNAKSNGARNLTLGGRLDVNRGIIGLGYMGKDNGVDATYSIRMGKGSMLHESNNQKTAISIGVGDDAVPSGAKGSGGIAIGYDSYAGADIANNGDMASSAVAIGNHARAGKWLTTAIGTFAETTGEGNVAVGYNANAGGLGAWLNSTGVEEHNKNATAVGHDSLALKENTSVYGNSAKAYGSNSTALGQGAVGGKDGDATKVNATAVGQSASAADKNTTALGQKAAAEKEGATAIGQQAVAKETNSTAVGLNAKAEKEGSTAIGQGATANANVGDVALGNGSTTAPVVATNEATVNGIKYSGFAGNAPAATVSVGGTIQRTITNVGAGRIDSTSTDAINGSQLYLTQEVIGNIGQSTVNILGGNAKFAPNKADSKGNITMTNIGGTGKDTVDEAIKHLNNGFTITTSKIAGEVNGTTQAPVKPGDTVTVDAGSNIQITQTDKKISVATKDDLTVTSVKAGDSTLNTNGLTINGGPSITKTDGVNAGGKQITNVASGGTTVNNAANIGDVQTATAAAKTEVKAGTNVTVDDSEVTADGHKVYKVNADGTKVEHVAGSPVTVTAGQKDANNVTTYKVDLTQDAKDSLAKVATNEGNITALQNQTFKLQANNDVATPVKASDTVKFIDGDNINITRNGNNVTVSTAKDVTFDKVTAGTGPNKVVLGNNGVEVGGNVYISNDGLNANNKVITNVAPGAINANSTDAVNGSQLHATNLAVQNLQAGVGAAKVEVEAGNNVTVDVATGSKGQNIYTVHAEKTTVSGSNMVNVTAGPRSAAGVTNYAVDLSQQAKADIADGVAAKNIVDTKGLTFTADSGTTGVKKLGDSVAVNGDNKNITTKATPNGVEVSLNNSISVANVSADAVNIKGNGPRLNQNGAQMANTPITNMASGLPIDPVTGKPMTTVQIEQGIIDGTIDPSVLQNAVNVGDLATQAQNAAQVNNIIYGTDSDGNPYVNGNGTMTSAGRAALRTYNVDGKGTYERNGIFSAIKNMNEQGIKFFHTNDGVVQSVKDGTSEEDSNAEAAYSTAIGYKALVEKTAVGGLAIGAGARAVSAGSVALGAQSEAAEVHVAAGTRDNAYTYGGLNDNHVAGKPTSATSVLSVGKPGAERQVQNVAAGVISETSTDAINGSQLYQTNKAVENNTRAINQLRGDVHKMDNKLRAGVAGAYAAASLGQVYIPGKTQVSLGSGHYRGESAVALGVSRVSDSGKVQVRLIGSTNTRGDTGAGASVSYLW